MYTTLATLKQTDACVGGYTRMLSFMTTKPKETPIPLWMVGMIGQWDDLEWALDNSLIIDKDMFGQFYKATVLSVFKHLYWTNRRDSTSLSKNTFVKEFMKQAEAATTADEALAALEMARTRHFSNDLWDSCVENPMWIRPHEYIKYVINNMGTTVTRYHREARRGSMRGRDEQRYFPYNSKLSKAMNFALLCTGGRDPYIIMVEIMMTLKLGKSKGFQMSSMVEGDTTKYAATLHVSDPKKIFLLYHILNGADVDIGEVTGVNNVAASISAELGDSISDAMSADAEEIKKLIEKSPTMALLPAEAALETPVRRLELNEEAESDEDQEDEDEYA